MRKSPFFKILVPVLLLTLAVGSAPAAGAQPAPRAALMVAGPASAPWEIGWVDNSTSTNVGKYPSMVYHSLTRIPIVGYYDAANGDLMTAGGYWNSYGNCGTDEHWRCQVQDGSPAYGNTLDNVGMYGSADFWSGMEGQAQVWKLGFAYHDETTHALRYYVIDTSPGHFGEFYYTILTPTPGGDTGLYTSLKFGADGIARIAYYSHSPVSDSLGLAIYLGAATGNCGEGSYLNFWRCETIDSGTGVGQFASLAMDYTGYPAIAYYDAVATNLKYASFVGPNNGNCARSNSYSCLIVDGAAADVGRSASLTPRRSSSDVHRIAYYDRTNGKLKFAFENTTDANCGLGKWFCMNVDTIGASIAQVGISMAVDQQGKPIIAYMDGSSAQGVSKLKIVRPASAYGLNFGNCGDGMPNSLFYYWQCTSLDSAAYGYGMVDLASFTSVAVSPGGLAYIAYTEQNEDEKTISLKYAVQWFRTFLPQLKR